MAINIRWFPVDVRQNREKKEKYEQTIRAGGSVFTQRLYEIVAEEIEELLLPPSFDSYDEHWSLRQADRLGQLRSLRKILDLLEHTDGKRPSPLPRKRNH